VLNLSFFSFSFSTYEGLMMVNTVAALVSESETTHIGDKIKSAIYSAFGEIQA
jgi:hypothetical protein